MTGAAAAFALLCALQTVRLHWTTRSLEQTRRELISARAEANNLRLRSNVEQDSSTRRSSDLERELRERYTRDE